VFRQAAVEPLHMVGVDSERAGHLVLEFDNRTRTVLGHFVFDSETTVRRGRDAITFRPGDRVACFRSLRFQPKEVRELVREAGWHELTHKTDAVKAHLVLAARGSPHE